MLRRSIEIFQICTSLSARPEFLGDPERAHPDLVRALQQLHRRPVLGLHVPLELPVLADERDDVMVDEGAYGLAHHALFFGEAALDHVLHSSSRWRER
jgi:hypothetical protein